MLKYQPMKLVPFFLCLCFSFQLRAQATRDSLAHPKGQSVSELFNIGKNTWKDGKKTKGRHAPFKGHWSGFHYGFVNYTSLPEAWKSLEPDGGASFAMHFNPCKYSINLSPRNNFGIVTGLGLEYQRLRFNNDNISLVKSEGNLEIIHPLDNPKIDKITRSTLKNLYLTVPLLLEVQFPAKKSQRMYVSGGIMGGIRVHTKTKIVYEDSNGKKHKQKEKGNFNTIPFKADAVARIGFSSLSLWGSYTLTNLFKSSAVPDSHLYSLGIGVTF